MICQSAPPLLSKAMVRYLTDKVSGSRLWWASGWGVPKLRGVGRERGGGKNYQGGRCRSRSPLTDSRALVPWSWQLFWDPCHFVNLVVLALVGPGDQTSPFFAGESVGASSDLLFTYLCKIA